MRFSSLGEEQDNSMRQKWGYLSNHPAFLKTPFGTLLRLSTWKGHCLFHVPTIVSLPAWGIRMYLPPEWRGVAKLIYSFREMYEPELLYLGQLLSACDTFVDVGASYGLYTLVGASIVGQTGRVISFEPASRSSETLKRNIELNGLRNVTLVRAALSDHEGRAKLYLHDDSSRNSLGALAELPHGCEEVQVLTLDDLMVEPNLGRLKAIKMDVEGAEEMVLRGGEELLAQFRPAVIFEINPGAAMRLDLSPTGAWDILARLGYLFYRIENGEPRRICGTPSDGNVLACVGGLP
jgi:FkbM family methyltransferase